VLFIIIRDYFLHLTKNLFELGKIKKTRKKCHTTKYNNLSKITVPTLILWTKDDAIFPISIATVFQDGIKNTKFETLEGNHDWILYNPNLFYKKTTEFIK